DLGDADRVRLPFAALRFFFAFLFGFLAGATPRRLFHEGQGLGFVADGRIGAGGGVFDRGRDLVFVAFATAAAGGEAEGEGQQERGQQQQVKLSHGEPFRRGMGGRRKLPQARGGISGRRVTQPPAEERPLRGSIFATSAHGAVPPSRRASRCSTSAIRSERALIASAIGSGRW